MSDGVKHVTCPVCEKDGVALEYQQPDPLTGNGGGWLIAWNSHPGDCDCGLTEAEQGAIEDAHFDDPPPHGFAA